MPNSLAILPKPQPRVPIAIRLSTLDDLPFIDALQKMHGHMVGWFPRKQMEKYIEGGHVLIAEEGAGAVQSAECCVPGDAEGRRDTPASSQSTQHQAPSTSRAPCTPVGYIIAKYEYMKRDELGIVYQLNVLPIRHRNLVGASLVKGVFDRAPYGCRLFCCWCAQDIQANWFWESIGFVPLAFRTGSRSKQRIHIFWQRRVRDERNTGETPVPLTPYWFPAKTEAGAIGEDRIVLPIPPGTHWRDAKPTVLPGLPAPAPLNKRFMSCFRADNRCAVGRKSQSSPARSRLRCSAAPQRIWAARRSEPRPSSEADEFGTFRFRALIPTRMPPMNCCRPRSRSARRSPGRRTIRSMSRQRASFGTGIWSK